MNFLDRLLQGNWLRITDKNEYYIIFYLLEKFQEDKFSYLYKTHSYKSLQIGILLIKQYYFNFYPN